MKYYVNAETLGYGDGSREHPFKTIGQAAAIALPGDTVSVAPGIYREAVDPACGGTSEQNRITYVSEQPLAAVITGSEVIKGWENIEGTVWKVSIPNALFGNYNPYKVKVFGDWFDSSYTAHTGELFLNGKSFYEVTELSGVTSPVIYKKSRDNEYTLHTWYTAQDEDNDATLIYANFQGADPNAECVELTFRSNCFHPSRTGINYITLSGFTVRQAATQWAPPTAFQEGMIGPHWSKGWIIEDCEISHAKCSGISLGKYYQEGNDNKWSLKKYKDGTQTQRDCVCIAQVDGWSKETVGSHIVRRCNIHDCGQTGIVGQMGCVFSIIEDNHIHHINNKQNLAGAEIGGIKFHAAIDVIIRNNRFDHCSRGVWLDWQAQGTRVTGNLFHDNCAPDGSITVLDNLDMGEDLFIEISHGPTLVDNNIFLSDCALKLPAQGIAVVHNLIAGSITAVSRGVDNGAPNLPSPRYTPYHYKHSTSILGFMTVLHGDTRYFNNIFVGREPRAGMQLFRDALKDNEWTDANLTVGTFVYDDYPTAEEYDKLFEGNCLFGNPSTDRYYSKLPVWLGGNVYFNGAVPGKKETDAKVVDGKVELKLVCDGDSCRLDTDLYDRLPGVCEKVISTELLGLAFEPEEGFENPDGSPIVFNKDYFGKNHGLLPLPGPFACGCEAEEAL